MKSYDHSKIEMKWQDKWLRDKLYSVSNDSKKEKYYALMEFPYPSGDGLHTGHVRGYTAMDIIARKRRMEGYDVLFPIGWDAFGLPTENYAIKTGTHPKVVTKQNTDNFRKQFQSLGCSFDWEREINTTEPSYYKWTQWIFLQLFKKDLAYKTKMPVNWCLSCKIGLANEEVIEGRCERCGGETEKRDKEQWMLRITQYADRLLNNLDNLDYLEQIKTQQRNWIGKSEGAELSFKVSGTDKEVKVFTTRPDTLFGATYVVLAPEHHHVEELKDHITNFKEVEKYKKEASKKTEQDRTDETKEKTGVELEGIKAINPANDEEIPIWIADYVLVEYGTGAIMAVPAHDQRDYEFAQKFNLPVKEIVVPNIVDKKNPPVLGKKNVERKNIHAIVKDPKTGKYLALRWKKHNWLTFPMGGVKEGETAEEAARREVREETGYTDLKFIKVIDRTVRAEYFAAHKDENRTAYTNAIIFELSGHNQQEVSKEEKESHEIVWLDEKDLTYEKMSHAEVEHWNEKTRDEGSVYMGHGYLINSSDFDGMESAEAKKKITKHVGGKLKTVYKLRDWVFSRQRYWGEPIPIIHCEKCGMVPIPEDELPLELPEVENYKPTDTGESPIANIDEWVNIPCPSCGGKSKRETDVMPNWAGSSWYFLRYCDPQNNKELAGKKALETWMPVDWYNGGMEHTTLHLLYSRFWNQFLYDIGAVPVEEPYKKRTSHGLILAEGGVKMSKSKGNVVNPDDVVAQYGADTLRVYEMFMGPFDQAIAWSTQDIIGSRKFLERVWTVMVGEDRETNEYKGVLHETIEKVAKDIENMDFNTAISQMMICINTLKNTGASKEDKKLFLRLLAPFAPHVAEELWSNMGEEGSIHTAPWPQTDPKYLEKKEFTLAVQVNGKVRGEISVTKDMTEKEVEESAQALPAVSKWTKEGNIKKIIHVKGKVINIVVG